MYWPSNYMCSISYYMYLPSNYMCSLSNYMCSLSYYMNWPSNYMNWLSFNMHWPSYYMYWHSNYKYWLSNYMYWLSNYMYWPSYYMCWPFNYMYWPSYYIYWPSIILLKFSFSHLLVKFVKCISNCIKFSLQITLRIWLIKKMHLLIHKCSVLWKIYLLVYQYEQKQLTINLNFITSICIQCIITNTRIEDEAYNEENVLYYWMRYYAFWTSTGKPVLFRKLWKIWCY